MNLGLLFEEMDAEELLKISSNPEKHTNAWDKETRKKNTHTLVVDKDYARRPKCSPTVNYNEIIDVSDWSEDRLSELNLSLNKLSDRQFTGICRDRSRYSSKPCLIGSTPRIYQSGEPRNVYDWSPSIAVWAQNSMMLPGKMELGGQSVEDTVTYPEVGCNKKSAIDAVEATYKVSLEKLSNYLNDQTCAFHEKRRMTTVSYATSKSAKCQKLDYTDGRFENGVATLPNSCSKRSSHKVDDAKFLRNSFCGSGIAKSESFNTNKTKKYCKDNLKFQLKALAPEPGNAHAYKDSSSARSPWKEFIGVSAEERDKEFFAKYVDKPNKKHAEVDGKRSTKSSAEAKSVPHVSLCGSTLKNTVQLVNLFYFHKEARAETVSNARKTTCNSIDRDSRASNSTTNNSNRVQTEAWLNHKEATPTSSSVNSENIAGKLVYYKSPRMNVGRSCADKLESLQKQQNSVDDTLGYEQPVPVSDDEDKNISNISSTRSVHLLRTELFGICERDSASTNESHVFIKKFDTVERKKGDELTSTKAIGEMQSRPHGSLFKATLKKLALLQGNSLQFANTPVFRNSTDPKNTPPNSTHEKSPRSRGGGTCTDESESVDKNNFCDILEYTIDPRPPVTGNWHQNEDISNISETEITHSLSAEFDAVFQEDSFCTNEEDLSAISLHFHEETRAENISNAESTPCKFIYKNPLASKSINSNSKYRHKVRVVHHKFLRNRCSRAYSDKSESLDKNNLDILEYLIAPQPHGNANWNAYEDISNSSSLAMAHSPCTGFVELCHEYSFCTNKPPPPGNAFHFYEKARPEAISNTKKSPRESIQRNLPSSKSTPANSKYLDKIEAVHLGGDCTDKLEAFNENNWEAILEHPIEPLPPVKSNWNQYEEISNITSTAIAHSPCAEFVAVSHEDSFCINEAHRSDKKVRPEATSDREDTPRKPIYRNSPALKTSAANSKQLHKAEIVYNKSERKRQGAANIDNLESSNKNNLYEILEYPIKPLPPAVANWIQNKDFSNIKSTGVDHSPSTEFVAICQEDSFCTNAEHLADNSFHSHEKVIPTAISDTEESPRNSIYRTSPYTKSVPANSKHLHKIEAVHETSFNKNNLDEILNRPIANWNENEDISTIFSTEMAHSPCTEFVAASQKDSYCTSEAHLSDDSFHFHEKVIPELISHTEDTPRYSTYRNSPASKSSPKNSKYINKVEVVHDKSPRKRREGAWTDKLESFDKNNLDEILDPPIANWSENEDISIIFSTEMAHSQCTEIVTAYQKDSYCTSEAHLSDDSFHFHGKEIHEAISDTEDTPRNSIYKNSPASKSSATNSKYVNKVEVVNDKSPRKRREGAWIDKLESFDKNNFDEIIDYPNEPLPPVPAITNEYEDISNIFSTGRAEFDAVCQECFSCANSPQISFAKTDKISIIRKLTKLISYIATERTDRINRYPSDSDLPAGPSQKNVTLLKAELNLHFHPCEISPKNTNALTLDKSRWSESLSTLNLSSSTESSSTESVCSGNQWPNLSIPKESSCDNSTMASPHFRKCICDTVARVEKAYVSDVCLEDYMRLEKSEEEPESTKIKSRKISLKKKKIKPSKKITNKKQTSALTVNEFRESMREILSHMTDLGNLLKKSVADFRKEASERRSDGILLLKNWDSPDSGSSTNRTIMPSNSRNRLPPTVSRTLTKSLQPEPRNGYLSNPKAPSVQAIELEPLDSPSETMIQAYEQLSDADWQANVKGVQALHALVKFHRTTVESDMHKFSVNLSKAIKNLRLQVARAACMAATELFAKRATKPEIEAEEVVIALLHRTADTVKCMRLDAIDALIMFVKNWTATRVIIMLQSHGVNHRHPLVRSCTALFLELLAQRLGMEKILTMPVDFQKSFIGIATHLLQEGRPDTRKHAKVVFHIILDHTDGLRLITSRLSADEFRNVEKSLQVIQKSIKKRKSNEAQT